MKTPTGKRYCIQCTTWRDKKQVVFLSTNRIGASEGLFVKRGRKGKRQRDTIPGPMAQLDYSTNFNAVDRNDRDSADYSTTIRTARYFLRIFCWALNRAVHTCFTVVIYLAAACIGKENWKTYRKATNGRHDFQIDLGLDLMAYAIALEWDGVGKRPGWMRQMKFLPCDCRKCYFCVNGHTNGIEHPVGEECEVVYANGARVLTVGCVEEHVNILNSES